MKCCVACRCPNALQLAHMLAVQQLQPGATWYSDPWWPKSAGDLMANVCHCAQTASAARVVLQRCLPIYILRQMWSLSPGARSQT